MDKFGFFKLLNSFLTPSTQSDEDFDTKNGDKNNDKSDALSSLLKNLTEQNSIKEKDATLSKPPVQQASVQPTPPPPLQASMLRTMISHDDFIKRVQSKNSQPVKGD